MGSGGQNYQTAECGRQPVNKLMKKLVNEGHGTLDFRFETPRLEDDELRGYVKDVWETHKGLSGIQLSNATHLPGEPWTIVKDRYGNLDQKPTIPNDLIEAVFKSKMAASDAIDPSAAAAIGPR